MKKLVIILLSVFLPIMANAGGEIGQVVNVDGIYYQIDENNTVAVTRGSEKYTGDVVIPDMIEYDGTPYSVTKIKAMAFSKCTGLTSITIPSSITRFVGDDIFEDCVNLTAVYISDLEAWCRTDFPIGSNPLEYAHHLYVNGMLVTDLTLSDGMTKIGDRAFFGCSDITSIDIPSSVTSVGAYAFNGTAWFDSQPDGMVYVGRVAYTYKGTMPYDANIILDEGTLGIAGSAFQNNSHLMAITIPGTVECIGRAAFFRCNSMITVTSAIVNPFPIDDNVFSGCNVAMLYCPAGTIPAYQSTPGWQNFNFYLEIVAKVGDVIRVGGIYYEIGENNTAIVISGDEKYSGDVVIPAQFDYYGTTYTVTGIKFMAFYNCTGLTSITIPSTITRFIGDDIFENCWGLTAVYISDLEAWCRTDFPAGSNPLEFAHHLYVNGMLVTDLTLSDGMTKIGDRAFFGCSDITSIDIPNSVTSVGAFAFNGTAWFDSQPDGMVYVGRVAYTYKGTMPDDTSIILDEGTLGIAGSAFQNNGHLMAITIPGTVECIGRAAFFRCNSLILVTSAIVNPFPIDDNVFSGCDHAHLRVPVGTADIYRVTDGWRNFAWIDEWDPSSVISVDGKQNGVKAIFSMKGEKLAQPSKGINIIKMEDGKGKKVMIK